MLSVSYHILDADYQGAIKGLKNKFKKLIFLLNSIGV